MTPVSSWRSVPRGIQFAVENKVSCFGWRQISMNIIVPENTAGGTVTNSVELGVNAKFMGNIVQSYNQGVKNAHTIQWYVWDNELEYPEENVQEIEYTSGI
jgi:hypothetical protein